MRRIRNLAQCLVITDAQGGTHLTRAGWGCVAACLLAYAIFIGANFAPVAAGSDSGGYYNSAKLLVQGQLMTPMRTIPEFSPEDKWLYTPLGFTPESAPGMLTPSYPVGLPLHYAAASIVAGWHWGPLLVGVLSAVMSVIFTYGAIREFAVRVPVALVGALSLALSPILLYISFVPMSDAVATAWVAGAFFGALRSRQHFGWAIFSGFAFAAAVLIRPTNILLGPPLALLLWHWRSLLGAALGGLPGAIWHAVYAKVLFGSIFRLGYGTLWEEAFDTKYVALSWKNYLQTFPYVVPALFIAVALLPVLPWRTHARQLVALVVAVAGLIVFYSYYNITHLVWWYTRFLLPIFPAAIVLACVAIDRLLSFRRVHSYSAAWALWVVACVAVVWNAVYWTKKHHIMLMKPFQQPYVLGGEWAAKHIPKDALVLSMQTSSALYFYTDLPILRWDITSAPDAEKLLRAVAETKRPLYAMVFPFERDPAIKERFPGNWEKLATFVDLEVWRWGGPAK
jgi:hypothetical protein